MSGKGNVPLFHRCPARQLPGTHFKHGKPAPHKRMNSRICRCSGEPMPEEGNARSRNPNVCASCSSMADGMEDSTPCENASPTAGQKLTAARTDALARDRHEVEALEPAVKHS